MESLAQAIERLAAPVLGDHGLTLVALEVAGGRRLAVRFYVDKPGGVGIDDCQRFSREIGDVLDAGNLVPESFDLEVSSPGLDRELRTERELRWAVGKRVRAWTREPVDGQREFAGRLGDVEDAFLTLAEGSESGDPGRQRLPRALLTKVRLEVELAPRSARAGRSA
jgi:ribosome maturation factor RimP